MASISETGHSVNISNFKLLADKCGAMGADYNPSNADLTLIKLTALWTTANNAHATLTLGLQNSKNPINDRAQLFESLNKLITRTIGYLNSTKASQALKDDAKGLADRIRGFNVTLKKQADGSPDPNSVSNSHQGFVQKQDGFKQLADLYANEAKYAPNEATLKVTALKALATTMKTANDNLGTLLAPVEMARGLRDKTLYDTDTGMLDVAKACKQYIKGAFGTSSNEYMMVKGIKFTRPKPKK